MCRYNELESLNNDHKEALKKIEELKMELKCLPEERVVETAEYKCLQSHFSVLYNESMQLKVRFLHFGNSGRSPNEFFY